MDQRCRESEGKAKIEGYMSVSDEEAHHPLSTEIVTVLSHIAIGECRGTDSKAEDGNEYVVREMETAKRSARANWKMKGPKEMSGQGQISLGAESMLKLIPGSNTIPSA